MSDPFKELVEQMARLSVPEDDTEENRERREAAASDLQGAGADRANLRTADQSRRPC